MIRGGLVTLPVRDVAQAVRFYVETLGMKLVAESPELTIIDAGEGFLIALRARPSGAAARGASGAAAASSSSAPASDVEGFPTVTLTTKLPFDETVAILENRGVSFIEARTSGASASFRDPDGNLLHLRPAAVIDPGSQTPT